METIPVSSHEEVENANQLPPITGSPSPLPVDDVAHNHEPNLMTSPEQLVDHGQLPPVGDGDVEQENAGLTVVIDDVENNQEHSISPSLLQSPENSVDQQQPPPPSEHGENQHLSPTPLSHLPEEKNIDGEPPSPAYILPPLPPSTVAEQPPGNPSPHHESPLLAQPSSPPRIEAEYPPENILPNDTSSTEILRNNQVPSPENEPQSPSLSPPPPEDDYPPENLSPNHESSQQPSSPSPPPTESEYPPENLNHNHESPPSKPPPSPSPSPTIAEGPPESPTYPPNPNSDHESPSSPAELQGNLNPVPSPILKQSPKDLSPSPSNKPNTLTPPLGVPLLLHAAATFSPNKPHISPWSHQETTNLIQAYQEKWYSLKKGPLKAAQWEEVAITVAARCGYDEPTKTSKQCRHKIEKLRKRYRTERGKPRSKATAWNFFKLMDNLEKGPLPISSSQPMALEYHKPGNANDKKRKNDVYDDEFLANKRSSTSRARSSNHHVANGSLATNLRFSEGGNRIVRGLRTPVIHKRKEVYQEEREEENNENGGAEEEDVAGQLAAEIKGFAEKFVKMENKKIEMMRDVERYRLEMENKRMEMIVESQQMLVETVNNAFGSSVKTHGLSAS